MYVKHMRFRALFKVLCVLFLEEVEIFSSLMSYCFYSNMARLRLPKVYVLIRSTTILVSSFAILSFLSRRSFYIDQEKLVSVDNNQQVIIIKKIIRIQGVNLISKQEHLPTKRILFWTKYSDTKPTAGNNINYTSLQVK